MLTAGKLIIAGLIPALALAQEATSGFDLRATVSAGFSRAAGESIEGGYRAVFYPTVKFNDRWTITGAYQLNSAKFYPDADSRSGFKAKGYLLQGSLNYSIVGRDKSIVIRAGQLSTAFGAFVLHYDDSDNPLISLPAQYGYYYSPISTLGLMAAQVDATWGKWDARVQLANSSASNPRGVFAHDQYANWVGGAGYTVRQGLRIGLSASFGPYLDRHSPFYFRGEAPPVDLPARAAGVDVEWARGHWNVEGEWQTFTFPYKAIPVFRERTSYAEVKRALTPRWYVASRLGYTNPSAGAARYVVEAVGGFRATASTLLKIGYEREHYSDSSEPGDNVFAMELVKTVHPLSLAIR